MVVAGSSTTNSDEPQVGRAALVVAHPDDEVLWFSSILRHVDLILFCFEASPSRPDWTEGRRRVLADYPLPRVDSIRLCEAEVFNGADWRRPQCDAAGLAVTRRPNSFPGFSQETYQANFAELVCRLGERLEGVARVYTHNPWGEYGHEEHVQVYRAVKAVQAERRFELWFDNYCSNKSHELMARYVDGFRSDYLTLPTDPLIGEQLKQLYQRHGCWTWFDDYVWFTHECFQRDGQAVERHAAGHFFPINYLRIEAPWDREQTSRWRRMAGQLRRYVPGQVGAR